MSRTFRDKRPKMRLGVALEAKQYATGLVRDGTPTHGARSCQRHGGCPHCGSDRKHSAMIRIAAAEANKNDVIEDLVLTKQLSYDIHS